MKKTRAEGMPIETPGCGGKAALFLLALVLIGWWLV